MDCKIDREGYRFPAVARLAVGPGLRFPKVVHGLLGCHHPSFARLVTNRGGSFVGRAILVRRAKPVCRDSGFRRSAEATVQIQKRWGFEEAKLMIDPLSLRKVGAAPTKNMTSRPLIRRHVP